MMQEWYFGAIKRALDDSNAQTPPLKRHMDDVVHIASKNDIIKHFGALSNDEIKSVLLSAAISVIRQARDICQSGFCVQNTYGNPMKFLLRKSTYSFVFDDDVMGDMCKKIPHAKGVELNDSFKNLSTIALNVILNAVGIRFSEYSTFKEKETIVPKEFIMLHRIVNSCVHYDVDKVMYHQLGITPWFDGVIGERRLTLQEHWESKLTYAKGLWFTPLTLQTPFLSTKFNIRDSQVLLRTTQPIIGIANIDAFSFKQFASMLKDVCVAIQEVKTREFKRDECMKIMREATYTDVDTDVDKHSRDKDLPIIICSFLNGWQMLEDSNFEYQCVLHIDLLKNKKAVESFVIDSPPIDEVSQEYTDNTSIYRKFIEWYGLDTALMYFHDSELILNAHSFTHLFEFKPYYEKFAQTSFLYSLPKTFKDFCALESFDINLPSLPEIFFLLQNVKVLTITMTSREGADSFPLRICDVSSIQTLYINENTDDIEDDELLNELPMQIADMENLTLITLCHFRKDPIYDELKDALHAKGVRIEYRDDMFEMAV